MITRADEIQTVTVTYGAIFLGFCLLAHLFIRARLPEADPYLFPLAALLAAFGLVLIYRMDENLARDQAALFVLGLAVMVLVILLLKEAQTIARYRYVIAVAGIALLAAPRLLALVGIGGTVNGAFLVIELGPLRFQPSELAKVAIIIFLASYLADNREVLLRRADPIGVMGMIPILLGAAAVGALLVLVLGAPVWSGVLAAVFLGSLGALLRERPSLKHVGPLLLLWGLAMLMLVVIRDLGSSLMFFGGFLVLLYIATSRLSFVAFGLALFAGGATFFAQSVGHVQERVTHVARSVQPRDDRHLELPARPVALRAGGGRDVRARSRQLDSLRAWPRPLGVRSHARLRAAPRSAHRLHLRVAHQRDGAAGVRCGARGVPDLRRQGLSCRGALPTMTSRSCSRPGWLPCSPSRCS